jgi:8-oxo-dGTP pyrophosphatase MutT (NUDIX family)
MRDVSDEPEARRSAAVILSRDGPEGLEVFMVRRHARAEVSPNVYVFPGGTVRDDDLSVAHDGSTLAAALSARADAAVSADEALGLYACAVRELFEEAGVLLAVGADGGLVRVDDAHESVREALANLRIASQRRGATLAGVLEQFGWRPAFDRLVPFAHWVTPFGLPARFDTHFFVAEMPAAQEALHCEIETSDGAWLTPRELMEQSYAMVFATQQHVRRLLPFTSAADLLAFARAKPIRRTQPTLLWDGPNWSVSMDPSLEQSW